MSFDELKNKIIEAMKSNDEKYSKVLLRKTHSQNIRMIYLNLYKGRNDAYKQVLKWMK